MDPNECVRLINSSVESLFGFQSEDDFAENIENLREHCQNLKRWMDRGGFAPTEKIDARIVIFTDVHREY